MNNPATTPDELRKELRGMRRGDLLILAERALELLPRAQLKTFLYGYIRVDDLAETGLPSSALLPEVQKFEAESLAGQYYEAFAVNSKNFMEHSRGTDEFVAEFNRLLDRCISAADSEQASASRSPTPDGVRDVGKSSPPDGLTSWPRKASNAAPEKQRQRVL